MEMIKRLILTVGVAATFMPVTSVFAMNDERDEREEDQKYDAEDQKCEVVSPLVAAAREKRNQLSSEEEVRLCQKLGNAVHLGNVKDAEKCLEDGADPNSRICYTHYSLLSRAVRSHVDAPEMVSLLLAYNANVNAVDSLCTTPLLNAIEKGKEEVVKILISAKANVHQPFSNSYFGAGRGRKVAALYYQPKYSKGTTPLMLACDKSQAGIVQMLLDAGACIHAKAADERTVANFVKKGSAAEQALQQRQVERNVCGMLMRDHDALQQFLLDTNAVKTVADCVWAPCCAADGVDFAVAAAQVMQEENQ